MNQALSGGRSGRNRTLTLDDADRARLSPLVASPADAVSHDAVLDRIFEGAMPEAARSMPRAFADLMIADPPYNMDKRFGSARGRRMDIAEYERFTAEWLDACLPLLKPDASVYVCSDWASSQAVYRALSTRATIRNRITWEREKGRGSTHNWKNSSEDIWFATLSDRYFFDYQAVKLRRRVIAPYRDPDGQPRDWTEGSAGRSRDTHASNFWSDLVVPFWSMNENTNHPTQKPEKLAARLVLASCAPGGVVFDPFLGSGTSAAVAVKLGRRFCGVEVDREWCLTALKRVEAARSDKRVQGYEGGVFLERNAGNLSRRS